LRPLKALARPRRHPRVGGMFDAEASLYAPSEKARYASIHDVTLLVMSDAEIDGEEISWRASITTRERPTQSATCAYQVPNQFSDCSPADDTHAAFNLQDFGMCRWQLSETLHRQRCARQGAAAGIGPDRTKGPAQAIGPIGHQRACRRNRDTDAAIRPAAKQSSHRPVWHEMSLMLTIRYPKRPRTRFEKAE
jgi:hypothetical protein